MNVITYGWNFFDVDEQRINFVQEVESVLDRYSIYELSENQMELLESFSNAIGVEIYQLGPMVVACYFIAANKIRFIGDEQFLLKLKCKIQKIIEKYNLDIKIEERNHPDVLKIINRLKTGT